MLYEKDYLVCDGQSPLITDACLRDEALLYNLQDKDIQWLQAEFSRIFNKTLSPDYRISELSGGQKVILTFLLAMASPARRILFVHLYDCLDAGKRRMIQDLINLHPEKEICIDV